MPAYSFEALDAQGQTRKGVLEADSAKTARGALRAQALIPLAVQTVDGTPGTPGSTRIAWNRRVFNSTQLTVWTRQLAGLVSSGLQLERALTALAEEADAEPERNLGLVLERLADDLENRQALKARLTGAALYPAIVTVVAIAIVVFLVTYVVPQVANVFAGTKRALPFLTVAMLGASAFVREWGWIVLVLLVAGVILLRVMLRNPGFRERFDAGFLTIPVIGRLARGYNSAQFGNTLAMLTSAGVPILRALQAAAETLNNRAMRADALDALVLVREGAPLASALAQKKRFPGLLSMFARLGEQTGQLPVMLQRAANQMGSEVQRRAVALATILEPLLIVTMGLVVMLIVLAVLLPIIQLNQWVR
jgi:general secretion pathway protein F